MRRHTFPSPWLRFLTVLVAIAYTLIMMRLLFDRTSLPGPHPFRYNLIPLRTITQYIEYRDHFNFMTWFKNLFGNIVLFIPIGVFAPLLSRGCVRFVRFIVTALAILLIVETVQLVTRVGSFDVDDLILNMAGALIGWIGIRLYARQGFKKSLS